MALKAIAPRLGGLGPRISGGQRDAHGHSRQAEPWRAWYHTARWRDLRLEIIGRDEQRCRHPKHDGPRFVANLRRLVCDHRRPHRGDARLFWDPANLQTLCKVCHDTHKQAEERRDQALGLF